MGALKDRAGARRGGGLTEGGEVGAGKRMRGRGPGWGPGRGAREGGHEGGQGGGPGRGRGRKEGCPG